MAYDVDELLLGRTETTMHDSSGSWAILEEHEFG